MVSTTPLAMTRRTSNGRQVEITVRAGLGEPGGLERLGDAMFKRHYREMPAAPATTGQPNRAGCR